MKIIFTMIPRFFLAVLNLVAYVYAAPLEANTSHSLEKRANPRIGPGFSRQEVRQISDGFQDAIRLAQYVVFAPSDIFDPIFVKYFDIRDRRKVTGKQIPRNSWALNDAYIVEMCSGAF